jgi:hypothetical protein
VRNEKVRLGERTGEVMQMREGEEIGEVRGREGGEGRRGEDE